MDFYTYPLKSIVRYFHRVCKHCICPKLKDSSPGKVRVVSDDHVHIEHRKFVSILNFRIQQICCSLYFFKANPVVNNYASRMSQTTNPQKFTEYYSECDIWL